MNLTNDDVKALNEAKIGEVVTLSDGRRIKRKLVPRNIWTHICTKLCDLASSSPGVCPVWCGPYRALDNKCGYFVEVRDE